MNLNPSSVGSTADVLYEDVAADKESDGTPTRKVRVATRAIGTTGTVANGSCPVHALVFGQPP